MSFTAAAVTGVLGNMLQDGFDLNDLTPMQAGERINYWDREVSFDFSGTLSDAFRNENKFSKYNLLATIMHTRENIPLNTPVEFFVSGAVKEIRVKKKRFRIVNSKYLGCENVRMKENDED